MAAQVDFYLIESADNGSRMRTVCRLAEKIHKLGHESFVLTADDGQSKLLDELMWTYSQASFLPHAIAGSRDLEGAHLPVLIDDQPPAQPPAVLINLKDEIPPLASLNRVVEVINQDEQVKVTGRRKYRDYQSHDFSIKTHTLRA